MFTPRLSAWIGRGCFVSAGSWINGRDATVALIVLLIISPLFGQADVRELPLDVGVRAMVDRPFKGFGKEALRDYGRAYYVMNIRIATAELDLVAPVDEKAVLAELHTLLRANGYREITETEKPQILLSVAYGRGYLPNPYLQGTMPTAEGLLSNEAGVGSTSVSITNPIQIMKQKQANYEAKVQNANLEKLFLRVTAFRYPESEKEKPKQVWQVTMLVDAPHRMDLNIVYKSMLAAGARYFNKEIEDQVDIRNPLHRGSVEVGTPTLLK